MPMLLALSAAIDRLNARLGTLANWLVLFACLVSAANAMFRYAFDIGSNAWLELQWYMFAAMVMFGASYTLQRNEHVRVDILYLAYGERGQHWCDLLGTLVFLIPSCVLLGWLSWPFFAQSFATGEISGNAGGLVRWPIKAVLPLGFALVALQGASEAIKKAAYLAGYRVVEARYVRPEQ
jgi:TRAP-type mannitol/chloroaromatic compound transport system permease small subunit